MQEVVDKIKDTILRVLHDSDRNFLDVDVAAEAVATYVEAIKNCVEFSAHLPPAVAPNRCASCGLYPAVHVDSGQKYWLVCVCGNKTRKFDTQAEASIEWNRICGA